MNNASTIKYAVSLMLLLQGVAPHTAFADPPLNNLPRSDAPRKSLQGGVSRVGVIEESSAMKGTVDMSRFGRPDGGPRLKLMDGVEGLIETPPIFQSSVSKDAPASMYRAWLEKSHPRFALNAKMIPPKSLVIIYGKYDDTGRTISDLGVPYTTINTGDVEGYDLSETKVIVVDCPGGLSPVAMNKLRDFVARGGYLFTTDWLLDSLIEKTFPGYIAWNKAVARKKMYDANLLGKDPQLHKYTVTSAYWKMDIHCHLIHIINKAAVRPLAFSRSLILEDPDHKGYLAVMFPFGRGYVMHMTAHFDRSQKSGTILPDPAPVIGISLRQAIAINFFVAGLERTKLDQYTPGEGPWKD